MHRMRRLTKTAALERTLAVSAGNLPLSWQKVRARFTSVAIAWLWHSPLFGMRKINTFGH
jgi:hypothetical protein